MIFWKCSFRKKLRHYLCSHSTDEMWIVPAGELHDSVIINHEIVIINISPAVQTSLDWCFRDSVQNQLIEKKKKLLNAAFREKGTNTDIYHVPNHYQLLNCCRTDMLEWNIIECFVQVHQQTNDSFNEKN